MPVLWLWFLVFGSDGPRHWNQYLFWDRLNQKSMKYRTSEEAASGPEVLIMAFAKRAEKSRAELSLYQWTKSSTNAAISK